MSPVSDLGFRVEVRELSTHPDVTSGPLVAYAQSTSGEIWLVAHRDGRRLMVADKATAIVTLLRLVDDPDAAAAVRAAAAVAALGVEPADPETVNALYGNEANPVIGEVVHALRVLGAVTRDQARSLLASAAVELTEREYRVVLSRWSA